MICKQLRYEEDDRDCRRTDGALLLPEVRLPVSSDLKLPRMRLH